MRGASSPTFPEIWRMRAPRGMPAAIRHAAKQRRTTPAEWARQTILRALEAEGVQLNEMAASEDGEAA